MVEPTLSNRPSMTSNTSRKNSKVNSRKGSVVEKPLDLDYLLVNEIGQFGCFQLRNILLVFVPVIMSAFAGDFIFAAAAIPHRCQIPECGENSKSALFEPAWILNAVPETESGFDSCERFTPVGGNGTLDVCPAHLFDQFTTVRCEGFVYALDNTVVYDFDLGCQEWMRVLAGAMNAVGTLLVLPFTGYVSDRYGRRLALVINIFNLGLFGLIRTFSVNYPMYLVLQIVQTTLGAGGFSTAYIFATELVGPKYRCLASGTMSSMFAVGQVILSSVAWLVQPWRTLGRVLYIPCFIIIIYYWILTESVRWLLSKQRYEEARQVLETVATVNKKQISENSMAALMNPPPDPILTGDSAGLFKSIFRSRVLLRRIITTPVWWITTTFVYYGISINSVGLSDTMYLNFILTSAIEIPGNYTAVLILDRVGRKMTLSSGFFLSAACNMAFVFVSHDLHVVRLILFMFGKFGISIVFTSLYLFTSELYPTEYRHTLLAFSSMIGRIGSISAPLTPALNDYWEGMPSMIFACLGLLAGLLVLTQPETLGTRMPDTLAEAEALGQQPRK